MIRSTLAVMLVSSLAIACNDSAGPDPDNPLVGTWEATAYVFTNSANTAQSVDVVGLGFTMSISFTETSFAGTMTIPGQPPFTFGGTYTTSGDQLTINDPSDPGPETMTFNISGNTLTLIGEDTYDFDDDGTEEPATTEATLERQ